MLTVREKAGKPRMRDLPMKDGKIEMTKRMDQAMNAAKDKLRKVNISLSGLLKAKEVTQGTPRALDARAFCSIEEGLTALYEERLLPLEQETQFQHFSSHSRLSEADFYAKPIVLIVGPYSVGKTSLIERLLGRAYPGMRVGPEPTTDRFTVIGYSPSHNVIPGGALIVPSVREYGTGTRGRGEFPKSGLERFGSAFLDRLVGASLNAEILKDVTFIDTPGVISGSRSYDYIGAMEWFGEKSDLIVVMVDALKPEISDDFKMVLESLKKYAHKMRFVVNKADEITSDNELLKVYGAILWSLGQVLGSPEVPNVLLGSFWSRGARNDSKKSDLFMANLKHLDDDIANLHCDSTTRKLDQIMRRARQVKAHAHLISFLKEHYPTVLKKGASTRLSTLDLQEVYEQLVSKFKISLGDLADAAVMRKKLRWSSDLHNFSAEKLPSLLENVSHFINADIPALLDMAQRKEPLHVKAIFGTQMRQVIAEHISVQQIAKYTEIFERISNRDNVMGLAEVRAALIEENCDQSVLNTETFSMLWSFVDIDKKTRLELEDFKIFMHLVDHWRHDEKSSCISLVERLMANNTVTTTLHPVNESAAAEVREETKTHRPCGDA
ncbi:EH domain-containing protein 1-like [Tropilaelaps mercedesae]|uniref:EH domain-containing protein 1-like n=1 Tax=Tropilaelaps mercedesae TaxID=418985 RepID=A0A1V9XTJ4_9ACAR|nr:EH domain-containing protein 1-like [Tropilaelaps mercedesae]